MRCVTRLFRDPSRCCLMTVHSSCLGAIHALTSAWISGYGASSVLFLPGLASAGDILQLAASSISWNVPAVHAQKYRSRFWISHFIACFKFGVHITTSMETSPIPPTPLGLYNRPGLTLCLLLTVDVECCHKNCFCMLCSSALAHFGSLKTVAVNNTAASMIAFSSIILTTMLVERLAAVIAAFWQFGSVKLNLRRLNPQSPPGTQNTWSFVRGGVLEFLQIRI